MENEDIVQQLSQAPPQAPTAADAEVDKAGAEGAAAQSLANAATNRPSSTPGADSGHPFGSWPYKEKPNAPDIGQNAPPPPPAGPAPGSVGFHLMNAFSTPQAKTPGGGVKALFSGVTDAIFPASWKAATSNDDASKPTTPPPQGPGRAQRIINNLGASFGDISAATEGGPEGGAVMGAARVARATSQRTQAENDDRMKMGVANAQMIHSEALTHKMGEDAINSSIDAQKKQMENITTAVPGAPPDAAGKVIATGKTSDDLNRMLQKGPNGKSELDPATQTVFADGRIITGKDANGLPLYRTTYSVVQPAKEVDITPENAKFLNESLGLKGKEAYPTEGDPMRLPGVEVNGLFQKANTANAIKRAAQVSDAKDQKIIDENQNSAAAKSFGNSSTFAKVLHAHSIPGKDGSEDPYAIAKVYDYLVTHPDVQAQVAKETGAANLMEAYEKYAGSETVLKQDLEDYRKAQAKNQDTTNDALAEAEKDPMKIEGRTPFFEAAMNSIIKQETGPDGKLTEKGKKAADVLAVVKEVQKNEIDLDKAKAEGKKEVAQKYVGNEAATTPQAFLKSLKPNEQATVKMVGEGRAGDINLAYLTRSMPGLLEAVAKSYPDFDKSKVTKYLETSKDFAAKTIANQLLSGGAVLQHLQEARDLNTNLSHLGVGGHGGPAYIAYQSKINTIANDLGQFYGDNTIPAHEAFKKGLNSTLPGDRESAILTQAQSMTDRLTGLVTRWRNASPSKEYDALMPWISPEGQHALTKLSPQFAQDYPDLVKQSSQTPLAKREAQQNAPVQFQGKIGVEAGGKTHYFNTQVEANNFKKLAGIH